MGLRWHGIERRRLYGGAYGRGLGVEVEWGTTGTTYGDPRRDMFLSLTAWLWWGWRASWSWKAQP